MSGNDKAVARHIRLDDFPVIVAFLVVCPFLPALGNAELVQRPPLFD